MKTAAGLSDNEAILKIARNAARRAAAKARRTDPILRSATTAIEAAVAEERARCAALIRTALSPRSGLALSRFPGDVLRSIAEAIERGDEP